jgi:hypothetical protein
MQVRLKKQLIIADCGLKDMIEFVS